MADLGREGKHAMAGDPPVEQREHFIADYGLDLYWMTELCERYDLRRKTGYTWLDRMAEGGRATLRDRSRAPHHCPHRIAPAVAEHRRRPAGAPRPGEAASAAPPALPSGSRGPGDARAQRPLDRRLQGPLPHP